MYGPPFQISLMNRKPSGDIIIDPPVECNFDPEEIDSFVIIFIDEANNGYTDSLGYDIGLFWEDDVDSFNLLSDDQKCAVIVFDIDTLPSPSFALHGGEIWPKNNINSNLPISQSKIIQTRRPYMLGNDNFYSQQDLYEFVVTMIQIRYGVNIWNVLENNNIVVRTIVDNSGSMTYNLIEGAIQLFKEFLDNNNIDHNEYKSCANERWLTWAANAHLNNLDTQMCCFVSDNNNNNIIYLNPLYSWMPAWNNETSTMTVVHRWEWDGSSRIECPGNGINFDSLVFFVNKPVDTGPAIINNVLVYDWPEIGVYAHSSVPNITPTYSVEIFDENRYIIFLTGGVTEYQDIISTFDISVSIGGCTYFRRVILDKSFPEGCN
jgi:hypothetical protein